MMALSGTLNIVRNEILQFVRIDKNVGTSIYILGLPIMAYPSALLSDQLDPALSMGLISICAINVFYAPIQLILGQQYYEGLFPKPFDFLLMVRGKLIFLQLANTISILILSPLLLFYFDSQRIIILLSFYLYSVSFASPFSMLISGIRYRFINNSYNATIRKSGYNLSHFFQGLISFLPIIILVYFFGERIEIFAIALISLSMAGVLSTSKICCLTKKRILQNKYFL